MVQFSLWLSFDPYYVSTKPFCGVLSVLDPQDCVAFKFMQGLPRQGHAVEIAAIEPCHTTTLLAIRIGSVNDLTGGKAIRRTSGFLLICGCLDHQGILTK